jgi:hypothetical protein
MSHHRPMCPQSKRCPHLKCRCAANGGKVRRLCENYRGGGKTMKMAELMAALVELSHNCFAFRKRAAPKRGRIANFHTASPHSRSWCISELPGKKMLRFRNSSSTEVGTYPPVSSSSSVPLSEAVKIYLQQNGLGLRAMIRRAFPKVVCV